jgi:hypothetical protein
MLGMPYIMQSPASAAKIWAQYQGDPYEICDGQSGSAAGLSLGIQIFFS